MRSMHGSRSGDLLEEPEHALADAAPMRRSTGRRVRRLPVGQEPIVAFFKHVVIGIPRLPAELEQRSDIEMKGPVVGQIVERSQWGKSEEIERAQRPDG